MQTNSYSKNNILFSAFLLTCVLLAFYFRINGLANGGFSNSDEYYIAKSVHNILEYGVPKYELGGYYTRGLIYQYLSAILVLLGIKEEFALRIIPLLFNMLALPALYLMGKKIGGKLIGVSILILFCFSILEIEYSRLARYYTPFQTIFIWYIFALYKVVIEKNDKSIKWILLLSFLGIFMYEGGILLVLLNFIPFILRKGEVRFPNVFYAIIIFIFAFIFLNIDFRNFSVTNYLPSDIKFNTPQSVLPIDVPYLFIETFPNYFCYLLLIIPLLLTVIYGFHLVKNVSEKRIIYIFLSLSILSLLNLYGIIFISFIVFYLIRWIQFNHLKDKSFYYMVGVLSVNFMFYFVYAVTHNSWLRFFPEESSISVNKIFWVFVNYPNFYEKIFIPWYLPLPILTIIFTLFIIAYMVINFFKGQIDKKQNLWGVDFILVTVIILICFVAILKTPYNDVRYTFFIYPIFLLIILSSMKFSSEYLTKGRIKSHIIFGVFFVTHMLFSSDYNANHLVKIDSNEVRFRTIYDPKLENIYYYQEDYLSPAEIINKNMHAEDLVITTQAPIEYYLKQLNYKYLDYKDMEFKIRSRLNGQREVWTNASLIYKEEDLFKILDNSKATIWLCDFSNRRPGVNKAEKRINNEFQKFLYYVNFDSTINVFKIPQKDLLYQKSVILSNSKFYN